MIISQELFFMETVLMSKSERKRLAVMVAHLKARKQFAITTWDASL
jgi:hypothetical protein